MAKFKFTRALHEQFAIEAVDSARRELRRGAGYCSDSGVYALVRANRDIARARTHLASIGGDEGKRTRKLWSAVGKVERQVDLANNRVAKCLLK